VTPNTRNVLNAALAALALIGGAIASSESRADGLDARIEVGKQRHRVVLLGRREGMVLFRYADSDSAAVAALDPGDIRKVRIRIEYDRDAYSKARRAKDWALAGAILAKALAPALQFVDIRENNVVSPAIRAATCFMRAAAVQTKGSWLPAERKAGEREYRLANALLQAAMKAEWSSRSDTASLMSAICLVAMSKLDQAQAVMETQSVPDSSDDEYGLYRLAQAHILVANEKYNEALAEAVDGLAFETKDIDTFPDSLLLSAHCYEKIGDWYRARDVYYEVARLFGGTHWDVAARNRLQVIMAEGHTAEDETVAAENVFFGIEEDINAKVNALLNPEKDRTTTEKENERK
jgi:hypothetical protein